MYSTAYNQLINKGEHIMKNIFKWTILISILAVLAGCKSAPVKNIDSAAIAVSGKYSVTDVKKAIIRAGASLGWSMKSKGKGHLLGTLNLRTHTAVVDITYKKDSYSIKYRNSNNLNYDGVNIHSNYNGWISNLNRNIQIQLNTL